MLDYRFFFVLPNNINIFVKKTSWSITILNFCYLGTAPDRKLDYGATGCKKKKINQAPIAFF